MRIHSEHIPDDEFVEFLKRMPQVSVELVVEVDGGILLLKRRNEPAKGEWFWPGTRLYKGETFEQAAHRLAEEELDITIELAEKLGVYNHFWEAGAFLNVETTHTVNVVFHARAKGTFDFELNEQHIDFRTVKTIEPELHPYVKQYLRDLDGSE